MADATATPEPSDATSPGVEIEDVGPALKRLTITVAPEAVAEKLEDSIGALSSEATLPGFRRGKVPRRLLEKRFGSAVRNETKNQLIADAYAKAIEEHGIVPVGEPEPTKPTDDLRLEEGKPLTFAVDVEVVPEFELPAWEGIEIKKPLFEITDEHVEAELARQLRRVGTAARIDGDFQGGDRIAAHVAVTKAGETQPLFEQEQALIVYPAADEAGRGPVAGLMIEGLADLLEGQSVGETLTIETVGPEAHEREDLRGAKLSLAVRIIDAERPEPATVDKLVEAFGLGSEANLRDQIRLALENQRDQEQANAMREQVYRHLLDAVDFPLPEKLSAGQASRSLEGHRLELLERGLSLDEVEGKLAELRADSETQTRDRLKLFFLLRRLADELKIEVSDQEVNGRLAAIAAQHGQRPEQLRAELTRTGRLAEVARMIQERKAADRVIAKAKIEEISAEAWKRLAAKEAPAATTTKKKRKKTTRKTAAGPKSPTKRQE